MDYDFELAVAAIGEDVRDELLTRVLAMLERFNDEHALGLDLPGRLELLDQSLEEFVASIESQPEPVH